MDDSKIFDLAKQGDCLDAALSRGRERRKKDKKNPLKWWGKVSETLEEKLGGGLGGSAKSLGAHAATGAGIGSGLALLIPGLGPLILPAAAAIGAGAGTAAYAVGKYKQPKEEEEAKSCYI